MLKLVIMAVFVIVCLSEVEAARNIFSPRRSKTASTRGLFLFKGLNMSNKKQMVGKRFGALVVLEKVRADNGRPKWLCVCDCGNKPRVYSCHLDSGDTKSCGCKIHWKKEKFKITDVIELLKTKTGCKSVTLNF